MAIHRANLAIQEYNHSALEWRRRPLRRLVQTAGYRILFKFDHVEGLENLPRQGPALLMMNHIAILDPIVVLSCLPRSIVPIAKAEGFRNPLFGPLMNFWRVIPVARGEADRQALRRIFQVLDAGEIVLMAPEGTRYTTLQKARVGVAYVASRSGVPVVPVALEGTDGFPTLSPTRWRGPGAVVRLGTPFRYRPAHGRLSHERLQQMMDEAMYLLAAMLPPARRGVYADLSRATTETIELL